MKDLETLIRRERFFLAVRRRWKLGLLLLPLVIGGGILLGSMEDTEGFFFKLLLVLVIAAGALVLLWLSSYIIIPRLKRKRTELYTKGLTVANKPQEKITVSTSRMLTRSQKMQAWLNLNELKDTCLPCFGGNASFLRLQWPKNDSLAEDLKYWDQDNRYSCDFTFNGETCKLLVERVMDENGRERVFACWLPRGAGREELQTAETVELRRNDPAVLAYGMTYDRADGVVMSHEELICIITWIGGKQ